MWPFVELAYLRLRDGYREALRLAEREVKERRDLYAHRTGYDTAEKDARHRGASAKELRDLDEERAALSWDIIDELAATQTARLLGKARRYGVPVPPFSDKKAWDEGRHTRRLVLSDEAMAELRERVEAARRQRVETTAKLMNGLIPLGGLLVALVTTMVTCYVRKP